MTTSEAFKYLINNWKTQDKTLKKKYKQSKYNFTHGVQLSEEMQRSILLAFGWRVKKEIQWQKPKKQ